MITYKYYHNILLIVTIFLLSMCAKVDIEIELPYNRFNELKSAYLDSIASSGKLVVIDLDDTLSTISIKRYNFIKRIGVDRDTISMVPIKSCSIINDTTVAASSDKGILRFIHSNSGALIRNFQQGWGPSEFARPQKIISNGKNVAIYDEGRNFVNILDDNYNHLAYVHIRNLSNINTSWLYQQPAFGFVNDGLWIINDVDNYQPVVQNYVSSGEISESFPVPDWFTNAPAAFQRYGIWASDSYLALASIGIPYILILGKESREIIKLIAINSLYVVSNVERILNKSSNIGDYRSVYELHFVNDRIIINFMSGLYEYDLSKDDGNWIYVSKRQPTDEELKGGEIVNDMFIRTAEDSVYYQPTSHHFYGDSKMIVCPNARDYLDIFEYRGTTSQ